MDGCRPELWNWPLDNQYSILLYGLNKYLLIGNNSEKWGKSLKLSVVAGALDKLSKIAAAARLCHCHYSWHHDYGNCSSTHEYTNTYIYTNKLTYIHMYTVNCKSLEHLQLPFLVVCSLACRSRKLCQWRNCQIHTYKYKRIYRWCVWLRIYGSCFWPHNMSCDAVAHFGFMASLPWRLSWWHCKC